jgi:hypothetical protein
LITNDGVTRFDWCGTFLYLYILQLELYPGGITSDHFPFNLLKQQLTDVSRICCLECPLLGSLFALHDWDGDLIHEIVNLGLQGFYERRGLWISNISRCFLA